MSQLLKKLVDFIKLILPKLKTFNDIKRFIKWISFATVTVIWYKYYRCRPHDNIKIMPDWNPITGHFLNGFLHWNHLNEYLYEMAKSVDFPAIRAMTSWRPMYAGMQYIYLHIVNNKWI